MSAATSSGTAVVTLPADDQILMTREFNAPKDLVYKAYTTPELVRQWWGGYRGEVTSVEIDLRVGGKWRYVMTAGSTGQEVGFHGEYREIVANERLVFTEIYEGVPEPAPGEEVVNIVTFTQIGGRTLLESLTQTPSKMVRDMIVGSGMEGGAQESFDLLEQVAVSLR